MCGVHSSTPLRYCDNSVECYDPEKGEWTGMSPMHQSRSNHCVQTLGKDSCKYNLFVNCSCLLIRGGLVVVLVLITFCASFIPFQMGISML